MKMTINTKILFLPYMLLKCRAFRTSPTGPSSRGRPWFSSENSNTNLSPPSTGVDPGAAELKDDLIALSEKTRRGFSASKKDRDEARRIIDQLSKLSPSVEPASSYYENGGTNEGVTVAGQWTLIYTDAPDITTLDAGPFSAAKLGRIGQDCNPPYIKNVIEWRKPDWAASLPFSGSESSKVLQKVCCEASASPDKPQSVDLKLLGLEIQGAYDDEGGESNDRRGLGESLLNGPAFFFNENPINLRGPLTAPFGKFDILYLDSDMRITKTYQGYFAVNVREGNPWF
mmetsp:Transcript_13372/g.28265  ORF Transcript_13372/g.28265 Transcript_13372/m.28265 type:complete len:286 (-) Transcript_13372:671-1528(-)